LAEVLISISINEESSPVVAINKKYLRKLSSDDKEEIRMMAELIIKVIKRAEGRNKDGESS
jgi:hypothetical protein